MGVELYMMECARARVRETERERVTVTQRELSLASTYFDSRVCEAFSFSFFLE